MAELLLIFALMAVLVLNERMGRKKDEPPRDDDDDPPLGIGGNL